MQTVLQDFSILNALDEAACVFEQLPVCADGKRDYKYVFVNNSFKRFFSKDDLVGQSVSDNFPNGPENWYDDYDEVLQTGIPKRFTRPEPSKNFVIEVFINRLDDGSGRRLISTIRNVTTERELETALKQSEALLQESERNLLNLIEQSPVAMALLMGPDMIVEIINKTFISLWGKDDSVRGKAIKDVLPELEGQPYSAILQNVYNTGGSYFGESAELKLVRNGVLETCYFNFVNHPYKKADGTIAGVIVVVNDVTDQVKANKGLSQTLERVRLSQEAAQFGIYDYDLTNDTLTWDKRCKELFGIFHDIPITYKDHFLGGLHPDDRERLALTVEDSLDRLKTGGNYDAEYRTIGKEDGIERWIKARGQVYFDENDKPLRFLGAVIDISDIKRYQHELELSIGALQRSETKFKQLVEQAPVSIAIFTGDKVIVEVANSKTLELWGKAPSIIGLPLAQALPELAAENQPFIDLIKNVMITGKRYNGVEERALLVKEGELTEGFYTYMFEPIKDQNGTPYAVMQVAVEVTQQVQSRLELQRAEEMLRFSVIAANAALWSMDVATYEFVVSDEFFEIYGIPTNLKANFQTILAQIPEEYHNHIKTGVRKAIESGEGYRVEHPVKTATGLRWLRAEGKVHPATLVRPECFSGLTIDITEQKLEEQRKNDFIGMVSHELKTPLTSLTAIIQLLSSKFKTSDDPFVSGATERASKQVARMMSLINGFLNVSRLESGQLSISKSSFDMEDLLEEVVLEARLVNASHNVQFERYEAFKINADREKINSVVSNLISNAVKYSPKGTTVLVTCFTDGSKVKVSVRDEGMGIKKEDQERLFYRYYRVENPNTKTISGFGIGLYLSSEIIKLHGGEMTVDSIVDKGSTFSFTLPVNNRSLV